MLKLTTAISDLGLNCLEVSFSDYEVLEYDLTDIFKDLTYFPTMFTKINEYIATLGPETQKELFFTFHKVSQSDYKSNFNNHIYVNKIENNLALVSEMLNFENFKIWLSNNDQGIEYPDNIQEYFTYDPDLNVTEEKTYIKHEYRNLIALILFIRAMTPLYIDYYNYIKPLTPHFYYRVFNLFLKTDIFASHEMNKLRSYIQANQQTLVGPSRNDYVILNDGLSDDDIVDSLLAETIFNKLNTIDFFNKKCNIVSFIFQTIKYKGNFSSSDNLAIRSKLTIDDANKEDISYFEDYRKTSNIPIGTIVEIQHALSNLDILVNSFKSVDFDYNRYNEELKSVHMFLSFKINKIQIYLLGWFLNRIINPRAIYYLEYNKLIELILFTKTVLLSSNQVFMATLLSSQLDNNASFINIPIRNNISKNYLKKITDKYKFTQDETKGFIIEKTILETVKEISNNYWIPINPPDTSLIDKNGHLIVPSNIGEQLIDFVEFVLN